jgi:Fe-S-cluster-containing dehydrogenase component
MATYYGMVIDLQKCVGCGACALSCKTENNTQNRTNGQTFNWADFIHKTEGEFPNVRYTAMPVLCNHCTDAACVEACPVTPKAMHKHANGMTMHNQKRCIGCRACQEACPYSVEEVKKEKAEYSVISFNDFEKERHGFYRNTTEVIKGGTASGAEIVRKAGDIPPHRTRYSHTDYADVRRKGVVEKCIFCEHRVKNGELPTCVVACPAGARTFGNLKDGNSEVSKLLKKNKYFVLKPEAGTKPNVYYIRNFKPASRA